MFIMNYYLKDIKIELIFFRERKDIMGVAYNLNQSIIAIGSGGLSGKGFLQGTKQRVDLFLDNILITFLALLVKSGGFRDLDHNNFIYLSYFENINSS